MTIILHSCLVLPDQSSNPFFRDLNILLTWKRSGRFINKCIYKWQVHYHLLWKLILSHDVMGKCVLFLNKFLTVTLPQPELSDAAASLPTAYHRSVFTPLTVSSQGIGKRPACQVPLRSAFSSWQESRQVSLSDVYNVYRGNSYPEREVLLRVSLSWKMGKHAESAAMLSILFLGAKMISDVTTMCGL